MKRIYKYEVVVGKTVMHPLPEGARIVRVAAFEGSVFFWAEIDSNVNVFYEREFTVFCTGHNIPDGFAYVGTARVPPFVWHVYENK